LTIPVIRVLLKSLVASDFHEQAHVLSQEPCKEAFAKVLRFVHNQTDVSCNVAGIQKLVGASAFQEFTQQLWLSQSRFRLATP